MTFIDTDLVTFAGSPWPCFAADEIDAVTAVLQSGKVNYWTGEEDHLFEKEFTQAVECNYGVALSSGTAALELALHALGIELGDEVVATSCTFLASDSAAVVRGIKPTFADVDCNSGNITADTIEAVLPPRTRSIITVHLGGWPCDMDPIIELAKKHNLKIIEDCAQCHGAAYKGRPCGSLGDVAAWSFAQDKIMTTGGEGGMLTTNNPDIWNKAWSYKDHGKSYDAVYNRVHPVGFRWLHEDFGTNWRMTEMQAAIGRLQLKKLPEWIATRHRNAQILIDHLSDIPALRIPIPSADIKNAYYRLYAYIDPAALKPGCSRDQITVDISSQGVPCTVGGCSEIYLEKAFEKHNLRPEKRLPNAKLLGETTLMFLVHPTLSEEQMHYMGNVIAKVIKQACL